jgi:peptide chain release factor subunit 3
MLLLSQAIFTAGYKAILHIHAVVEECEIMGLIHLIDPKTKKPIRKKVLFVKSGAVVVVRIQVGTHPVLLLLMGVGVNTVVG